MDKVNGLEHEFDDTTVVGRIGILLLKGATTKDIAMSVNTPPTQLSSSIWYAKQKLKKWNPKWDGTIPTPKTPFVASAQPKQATLDIGGTVNEAMKKYVPTQNGYLARNIYDTTDVEIMKRAYLNHQNLLLIGETGTGKTHLVRHFAFEHKLPYVRVNLNGGTTVDELLGHWVPSADGKFQWQDGLLTIFIRNGGVVALDEINACPAEILFCLHSLTDDERLIVLQSKDGEVVQAHENFFLVATMNPDTYEGTRPLNAALASRFIKLNFEYDERIENKLIDNKAIIDVSKRIRAMKSAGEISCMVSTRDLINFDRNIEIYGKNVAMEFFLNSFTDVERNAVKNVVEMVFSKKSD
jgi:nitric oxide reductase NorQ protein